MDASTKTYQVDKHKQLIPINGSMVNFSCFFEVTSKDKKPFNITIVEQGEIKPKQYKLVDNGYINGKLESDGQLKSYFLVLKSQQPCECNVTIKLQPKEANEQQAPQIPPNHPPAPQQHLPPQDPSTTPGGTMIIQKPESYFQMKYIIGISIAIIIIYLLYRYRKTIFGQTNQILIPSESNTSF